MTQSATTMAGSLPAGARLFEYRIEEVLGHGGFGITYRAQDTLLNKPVAIKEYLPSDLAVRVGDTVSVRSDKTASAFAWGKTSFLNEAQTLARFSHPNLVHIYRFFEAHGTAYFVMEYARGTTLGARLSKEGTLPETRILGVLLPVMEGLSMVHNEGILHRDVKPDNIMLKPDEAPVLIDFGAARQSLGTVSKSILTIASAGYSPLEQYSSGLKQGPWTDLYALAAVAYRAATGRKPPDAVDRVRNDPFVPASMLGFGKYSTQFLTAIDWALAVDAGDRPQSVEEWRAALEGAVTPRVVFKTQPHDPGPPDAADTGDPSGHPRTEVLPAAEPTTTQILHAFPPAPPSAEEYARQQWQRIRAHPWAQPHIGLPALATIAGAALLAWALVARPPSGAPAAAEAQQVKPADRMQAQLLFMQGQVAFSQKRNRDAVDSFVQALRIDPELQHDDVLVGQVIALLMREYDATVELIREFPALKIIDELSRLSGSGSPVERQRATRVLTVLGLNAKVDRTGDAIAALQEAKDCEGRLAAVRRLGELNDPRAIPPLKDLLGEGKGVASRFTGFFANSCLRDEAQAVLKKLERR